MLRSRTTAYPRRPNRDAVISPLLQTRRPGLFQSPQLSVGWTGKVGHPSVAMPDVVPTSLLSEARIAAPRRSGVVSRSRLFVEDRLEGVDERHASIGRWWSPWWRVLLVFGLAGAVTDG